MIESKHGGQVETKMYDTVLFMYTKRVKKTTLKLVYTMYMVNT